MSMRSLAVLLSRFQSLMDSCVNAQNNAAKLFISVYLHNFILDACRGYYELIPAEYLKQFGYAEVN